jgi:23S rRNA pseudouridine2605 synthase
MVLDEGRNREVRRLLARVGHKVQQLRRIAVGPVRLGDLPTGAVRPLNPKEIHALEKAVARGRSEAKSHRRRPERNAKKKISHKGRRGHGEGRTIIG